MTFLLKHSIKVNLKKQSFLDDPNSSFMVKYIFGDQMDGLYNVPEVIQQDNLGVAAYLKPSQMLDALRDVVLGKERFDAASGNISAAGLSNIPLPGISFIPWKM